jgi:hypothetical protein
LRKGFETEENWEVIHNLKSWAGHAARIGEMLTAPTFYSQDLKGGDQFEGKDADVGITWGCRLITWLMM